MIKSDLDLVELSRLKSSVYLFKTDEFRTYAPLQRIVNYPMQNFVFSEISYKFGIQFQICNLQYDSQHSRERNQSWPGSLKLWRLLVLVSLARQLWFA